MKIDSISKTLNTESGIDLSTGKVVKINDPREIPQPKSSAIAEANQNIEDGTPSEKSIEEIEDERFVKENLRDLIQKSMDLADDMFEFVRQSENPKSFEPASAYLKALTEMNEKLLGIHDRDHKNKKDKSPKNISNNQTNNNTIVCTSPQDILKAMQGKK